MSNLGRYQELVTEAKDLGGVESYLKLIEANAVAKAAPKLFAQGAVLALVAVGGFAGLALEIRRRSDMRRVLDLEGEAVRRSLAAPRSVLSCAWCGELGHDSDPAPCPLTPHSAASAASTDTTRATAPE